MELVVTKRAPRVGPGNDAEKGKREQPMIEQNEPRNSRPTSPGTTSPEPAQVPVQAAKRRTPRTPGQVVACGWCGATVAIPARGRVPKWCSPSCRHRAWEQARAAASGRSAVQVVDRVIDRVIEVEKTREIVRDVPITSTPKTATEWADLLGELTARIDAGRVYARDLPVLAPALEALVAAYNRRHTHPG